MRCPLASLCIDSAKCLQEEPEFRGHSASSMIHAAVCQAALDGRQGYAEEFTAPNAPAVECIIRGIGSKVSKPL